MAVIEEDNWNSFIKGITEFFEKTKNIRYDIIEGNRLSEPSRVCHTVWSKLFNMMVHEFSIPHTLDYSDGQHNSISKPVSYDKVSLETIDKIKESVIRINSCFDELFLLDFGQSNELPDKLKELKLFFDDIPKLEEHKGG